MQALTEFLLLNLRRSDLLCRYAGDRFGILLPDTTAAVAEEIGQQLAAAVRHFAYRTETGQVLYQRVSIGAATAADETASALLKRAGKALRQAKDDRANALYLAA
ncbi:hypothetical protein CAI21_13830 [Alkalilimnicola ehrlichii]|uniref:diguanylate cyclase n=1 Tax=Alkalilimnicola ehrlichii TaxID=351052 RepID=A0A3E0WR17_9GAMM|nr:hypothetical protein CAI21_13830 [Alkalilimnicola ehrlichii]RFA34643.1 hypothetical protein CAL65_14870 [Alkalilimnicola ehrlichii]